MVVGEKLIYELSNDFLTYELMDSFGVVYPQFWLNLNVEVLFNNILL